MVKTSLLRLVVALTLTSAPLQAANPCESAIPTAEPFNSKILTTGLDAPWDMVWGPDNYIWVTERQGKKITRVNHETGDKKDVDDIN